MSRETEHLRHEIENSRERMSETLDQLGDRLNPNRIKAQVKDNIREATVGRVENMARHAVDRVEHTREGLMDTIRENPIPAALIGIGLGWILFNGKRDRSHAYGHRHDLSSDTTGLGYVGDISATTPRLQQDDAAGGLGASISHEDGGNGVIDRVRGHVSTVRDGAAGALGSSRERLSGVASSARERISEVASRTTERVSGVRESVSDVRYRANDNFSRTLQDNPLAVGAVALAVGMAAGFAIPESSREREMMGPARDRLMGRAREAVGEARERAQETVQRVVSEVTENSENSTNSVGDNNSTNGTKIL